MKLMFLYSPDATREMTSRRVMWLSVLFPVAWLVFTLIRGAIVDFYPYPFVDVIRLGYAKPEHRILYGVEAC